jgi:hypothetical protein
MLLVQNFDFTGKHINLLQKVHASQKYNMKEEELTRWAQKFIAHGGRKL